MHSFRHDTYSFRADANALGGLLDTPERRLIPTLAPVSLPSVGGIATARAERFNLDEIVSCAAAYSRVLGVVDRADGAIGILATAVVEGLNILEVVTAERVVAQVSIALPKDGSPIEISLAGSRFEGLRVAGCNAQPELLAGLSKASGVRLPLSWGTVHQVAVDQAGKLAGLVAATGDNEAQEWVKKRHGWMNATTPAVGGNLLCPAFGGFKGDGSTQVFGHIVAIPGFGRFHFGELFLSRDSAELVMIRAELGCPVHGKVGVCTGGGGGKDGKS